MPICSAKQSNPSNNSEIWDHPGLLSVFQTPIWTGQLELDVWFSSREDGSSEAKPTSTNPTEAENRALRKCSYRQNLRLMKKLLRNQELNRGKFTQAIKI